MLLHREFNRMEKETAPLGRAENDCVAADHGFSHELTLRSTQRAQHHNLRVVRTDADFAQRSYLGDATPSAHGHPAPYLDSGSPAPIGAGQERAAWWLRVIAIAFSLGVHAAVLTHLLSPTNSEEQFGTIANKSDAISLATSQTLVLESIETETVQSAAAAAAASQAGSIQSAADAPQQLEEVKEESVTEPLPTPVKVAEATPAAPNPAIDPLPAIMGAADPAEVSEIKASAPADEVKEAESTVVEAKELPEKPEKKKEQQKDQKTGETSAQAQMAGTTTSRGSAAQAEISGRVSASRGNILSYAARVRAQVARNKPVGNGHRGTARIAFGITGTGNLSYVRLAGSSGKKGLDDAAIEAIRQAAPFGAPPDGASPDQLKFIIPFYFR